MVTLRKLLYTRTMKTGNLNKQEKYEETNIIIIDIAMPLDCNNKFCTRGL